MSCAQAFGYAHWEGYCEQGGQVVVGPGSSQSTTKVQKSYPQATVSVFYTGAASGSVSTSGTAVTWVGGTQFNSNGGWNGLTITINGVGYTIASVSSATSITLTVSAGTSTNVSFSMPATAPVAIFSDAAGTVQSNPFACSTTGYFSFYAASGSVDIQFSGNGVTSPFTWGGVAGTEPSGVLSDVNPPLTLAQLCSQAVAQNKTLTVSRAWPALTNQTCAANLQFYAGGQLQPASGQTVNLSSATQCPLTQQCYDISAGGSISFGDKPPVNVTPNNFGADSTGSVDSVGQFLAALKSVVGSGGNASTVTIPPGNYKWSSQLVTPTAIMLTMRGAGKNSRILWYGNNSSTALLIPNCFACTFENFEIVPTSTLLTAIQTENSGAGYTASADIFRSIWIDGGGNLGKCFLFDGPVDGNNDQQRIVDSHCFGYTSSCAQLGNASTGFNVFNVIFEHTTCNGQGFGQYGVWLRHGSFAWHNGDGGGNYGADFRLDTMGSGGVVIDYGEFECSKQFISTPGGGVLGGLTVSNITWDGTGNQASQAQILAGCAAGAQPGPMITYGFFGPARFEKNLLCSSCGAVYTTITLLQTSGTYPGIVFEDNTIGTLEATTTAFFTSQQPERFLNNFRLDAAGDPIGVLSPQYISQNQFFYPLTTGTCTPVFRWGGGTTGITYTQRDCTYTKVGPNISVFMIIQFLSLGSSTGVATVSGLPNISDLTSSGSGVSFNYLPGTTGLTTAPTGFISASLLQLTTGTGTALTQANFNTSAPFSLSVYYTVGQ